MSSANINLGPDAKVRLAGQVFAVTDGSASISADVPPSDDSESASTGWKNVREGGLKQLQLNLTAHQATDVSPHVAPLSIIPGSSVTFGLYPKGMGYTGYTGTMVVAQFEPSFRVAGSEPQTYRIQGTSKGAVTLPTD